MYKFFIKIRLIYDKSEGLILKSNMFKLKSAIALILAFVLSAGLFVSCKEYHRNKLHPEISTSTIRSGEKLAEQYCQSCHLLPNPSLLDAKTWEDGVLPVMGPNLGIFSHNFQKYPNAKRDTNLDSNFYPSKPLLTHEGWQNIIDYYTTVSPDSLPVQQRSDTIRNDRNIFRLEYPQHPYPSAGVCLTKIDSSISPHRLLLFDLSKNLLLSYTNQLQLTDSIKTEATFTDIDFYNNEMVACNINVINPNNGKFGNAMKIHLNAHKKMVIDALPLFDSLSRPVQITSCDLNNDKKGDYLVCEFGHLTGALSWMENTGVGYKKHILRSQPGVLKAYVEDYNHDGLQDVWALFSQGDEGIFLFTNKGNGMFDQRQVLRFPPIYGSTYFEFADFNKDGLKDVIYTCGDNADYSMVLKPYHGVYIFLNEGNSQFKQKYFFPINGCYKAMARDFDNDGDLDIATIAFFADYAAQPEEGFIFLKNEGNFKFQPYTLPETKAGRWLTMDSGDLDGDGKIDIVLGNFSLRPSEIKPTVNWQKGPPFIVLKNIMKLSGNNQ